MNKDNFEELCRVVVHANLPDLNYEQAMELVTNMADDDEFNEIARLVADDVVDATHDKLEKVLKGRVSRASMGVGRSDWEDTYMSEEEYVKDTFKLIATEDVKDMFWEEMDEAYRHESGAQSMDETYDSLTRQWQNGTL